MKILEIIRFVVSSGVMDLLPLPDFGDSGAVRTWSYEVCDVFDKAADLTTTDIDDKVVQTVREAIEDDTLWKAFWTLIHGSDVLPMETDERVVKLADDAKLSPVVVITIVRVVWYLYKQWKDRQNKDDQES